MTRRARLGIGLLAVLCAAGAALWLATRRAEPQSLTLYGNVELRQVSPAFNDSGRVAQVLVQEGDRVTPGQVLARLDTGRLQPQAAQAEAQAAAQRALLQRLEHGSRPEEIAQARANLDAEQAEARSAQRQHRRRQGLLKNAAVSREDAELAQAQMETADARVKAAQTALDLAIAGPRVEDIAQAQAQLRANEAQAQLLAQLLRDAELLAPVAGTVRSRLLEPGEMASPERPIVALSATDPKWVRAYVSEPELIRVHPGQGARIAVDGAAERRFEGWVGFISSVAEFTPKTIQTEELRTSLVYEVRIFVRDDADELRLGMPATVTLVPEAAPAAPSEPSAGPAPRP